MSEPAAKRPKLAEGVTAAPTKGIGGLAALGLGGGGGGGLIGSILGHIGPKQGRPDVRPLPVVLLVGAAGCGKGTQAQFLVDHLRFRHVSCGELYRKMQSADGSQLHKELQASRGKQEYDQRVKALHHILRKEFQMSVDDNSVAGLVIDGCRRSDQASNINRALRAEGLSLTLSLHLAVNTDMAAARLFCRLVHPASGRMYNTKTNPPKAPMTDDVTGEPLEIRDNDTDLHTFRIRMETWDANSEAVFNFLKGVSTMPEPIDANKVPSEVFAELSAALFGTLKRDFPLDQLTFKPGQQPRIPAPGTPNVPPLLDHAAELRSAANSLSSAEEPPITLIAVLAGGKTVQQIYSCRELMAKNLGLPDGEPAEQLRFAPLRRHRLRDESQGDVLAVAHNRLAKLVLDDSMESGVPLSAMTADQKEDEERANQEAVQVLLIDPQRHPLTGPVVEEVKENEDEAAAAAAEDPQQLQGLVNFVDRRAGLIMDLPLLSAEKQYFYRKALLAEDKDARGSVLRFPAAEGRPEIRLLLLAVPSLDTGMAFPVTDTKLRPVVRLVLSKTPAFRQMTQADIDSIFKKNHRRQAQAKPDEDNVPGTWETVKNNYNGQKVFMHTGTQKVLPIVLPKQWTERGWMVAANSSKQRLYWYNIKTKQSVWITPTFPMSPPDVDQDLSYGIRRPVQWRNQCDLHLHSTCSDGTLTPEQLMRRAHENGVRVLALTDHDTTSGVMDAMQLGVQMGIRVIPGIEVSSEHKDGSVHVLGYWANADRVLHDQAFQEFLNSMVNQRLERAKLMLSKLAGEGVHIELAKVQELADGVIGRPHVAEALKNAGYVDEIEDAFRKYLRYGRPAYVESTQTLPPEAAVAMIKKLGGLAVFAHPWCYRGNVHKVLQSMIEAGLDGMEVFKYPDNVKKFSSLCQRHNLIMTGGSDFHNRIKEAGIIERQPGELPLPPEHVERFLQRLDEVEHEYQQKQKQLRKLQNTKARLEATKASVVGAAPAAASSSDPELAAPAAAEEQVSGSAADE